MASRLWLGAALLVCGTAAPAGAQTMTAAGFLDGLGTFYPQTAPNDTTRAIGTGLFRLDPTIKWTNWRIDASVEARWDTHDMTAATAAYWDRTIQRPALTVRRLSAAWTRGAITLDLGKQFIRWGKTDIVVPTERFAPRDYLEVVNTELLGVTAARLALTNDKNAFELVFTPRMTPSRTPLFDQRWVVAPGETQGLPLVDGGAEYPGGPQIGARWNRLARRLEYSLSFFKGFSHLPEFEVGVLPDPALEIRRTYAKLTSVGGDVAVPLPWFTLKAESAWLTSPSPATEEFILYVIQVERQAGEWLFIGGYAGDIVTAEGTAVRFSPDRGMTRAFVGRASYTIDTNRSVLFETVARQNGDGFLGRVEYSQALGAHGRVTGGFRLIRGDPEDFLGQYRRNSSGYFSWRYSF